MHDMMRCRCAQPALRRRDGGVLGHRVGALGVGRGGEARLVQCRGGHWGVTGHRVGAPGARRDCSKLVAITGASPVIGSARGGRGVGASVRVRVNGKRAI